MFRRSVLMLTIALCTLSISHQVHADPPLAISDYTNYFVDGVSVFSGRVENYTPGQPLTVSLGNLFVATVAINQDGTFTYEKLLAPGTSGVLTAVASQGGNQSNTQYTHVYVP